MTRRIASPPRAKYPAAADSDAAAVAKIASNSRYVRTARYATIIALVLTAVALDPLADASFDAPKWLAYKWGAIVATIALLLQNQSPQLRWTRTASWSLAMFSGAFTCALAATTFSPHGSLAWHSLAGLLVCALFLVIGASRATEGPDGKQILTVAIVVGVLTATLSLVQAAGLSLPLDVQRVGGRFATGALLGNEGFVALLCALMGACGVALILSRSSASRTKLIGLAITLLAMVTIAVNRQATSAIALAVATITIAAIRFGQRWVIAAMAAALALALTCAAAPTLRNYTYAALPGVTVESVQRLTTYRLGAWVAATEMIRTDPWLGQGPGSFARESTARRLDAEVRVGARFVQPTGATFVYAHMDLLQFAAECGVPAAILVFAAFAAIFRRMVVSANGADETERLLLLGVAAAGAVGSLAWFPFQIPVTAMALLLACGRLWRLCADRATEAP